MTRDLGLVAALQSVLPPTLVGAVVLVTHAGGAPVLFGLLALRYWLVGRDRQEAATLVGLAVAAVALVIALKAAFGLARPPADSHLVAADGFGFPSGHALQATVVYGGLAILTDRFRPRRRWALAGVLIAAIATSRVVLGVHFAVDVVAGVAAGATLLWSGWRLTAERPDRGFGLALGLAIVAGAASAWSRPALVVLALAMGGLVAWHTLPPPVPHAAASASPRSRWGLAALGLALVGGFGLLAVASGPTPVAFLAGGLAAATTVGLPGAADRLPVFCDVPADRVPARDGGRGP